MSLSSVKPEWNEIVEAYRAAGGAWPFKKVEVALWALQKELYKPSPEDILRMCADSLADAMRESTFKDESGLDIRRMLPARTTRGGEQGTFWDDFRTAPIDHVQVGVAQRRNAITGECFHLDNMVRYSNAHRPASEQIDLVLDFTNDVREMRQPVTPAAKRPRLTLVTPTSSSNERRPQPSQPQRARRRSTLRPEPSHP